MAGARFFHRTPSNHQQVLCVKKES
jgi:hypothetical protein